MLYADIPNADPEKSPVYAVITFCIDPMEHTSVMTNHGYYLSCDMAEGKFRKVVDFARKTDLLDGSEKAAVIFDSQFEFAYLDTEGMEIHIRIASIG